MANEFLDWAVAVPDETKVYQRKLLVNATWPKLPNNSSEKLQFLHETKLLGNKYDESTTNIISKWLDCPDKQLGDYEDILRQFHENPQGLGGLDRIIGAQWAQDGLTHPVFGGWNHVLLAYCDGGSFSGDAAAALPWPNPVAPSTNATLFFRGRRVLQLLIHELLARHGMASAEEVMLAGGSACGGGCW